MIPKIICAIDSLKEGVNKTHILDGNKQYALLLEIFTDKGIGTEIHLWLLKKLSIKSINSPFRIIVDIQLQLKKLRVAGHGILRGKNT